MPALASEICAPKQIQPPQLLQLAQMLDAGIGQLDSVKVEILQLGEAAQMLQPLIGDQSAEQVQPAQVLHLRQRARANGPAHRRRPDRAIRD